MNYRAYNLTLASDFSLTPLHGARGENGADVSIRRGTVFSGGLPEARVSRAFAQVADNRVWLDVSNIARFLIEDGQRITVEPYPGADEDSIRLYLLGSGLGAILHQRGNLVLHANAVRVGDAAVLFAGTSGAGKSTTAAVFHQKGFPVIADDVVAVNHEGCVIGGFPQIKLWEDALHHLKIDKDGLDLIRHQMKKYSYPIDPHTDDHLPVKAVYFLASRNEHEEHQFEFHPLEGIAQFNHLKRHTYRPNFMEGLGLKPHHLKVAGRMAEDIVSARIVRPSRKFNAEELVDRVLKHLQENGISTEPRP